GLAVLTLMSFRRDRERSRDKLEAVIFVGLAIAGAFLLFGDALVGRISQEGLYDVSRVSVYKIVLGAISDNPLLGYGYGTFADVFPMFRDRSISTHGAWPMALNSYLDVLQDLGVLFGGALIACLGLLVAKVFTGALRREQGSMVPCIATAVAFQVSLHALV